MENKLYIHEFILLLLLLLLLPVPDELEEFITANTIPNEAPAARISIATMINVAIAVRVVQTRLLLNIRTLKWNVFQNENLKIISYSSPELYDDVGPRGLVGERT